MTSLCLFTNRTLYFTVNLRNGKIDRKCHKPLETICTGVPTNICGAMSDMIYSHMLWPRATKSGTITQAESQILEVCHALHPKGPGFSIPKFVASPAWAHTLRETAATFCTVIKLDVRKIAQGRPRMLTRNMLVVANLLVNGLFTEPTMWGHWNSRIRKSEVHDISTVQLEQWKGLSVECSYGQVVYIRVPLSPSNIFCGSSIIWHQPMVMLGSWGGNLQPWARRKVAAA